MFRQLAVLMLAGIALTGWGENSAQRTAFIFIEERPPFTSEEITAKSKVLYVDARGRVQQYTCEDDKLNAMRESVLPVTELFKILSGLSLQSLPSKPEPADAMQPLSQAHPGHTRIVIRQQDGAEYQWAGTPSAVPSALQKLIQKASALGAKAKPSVSASVAFVRSDVMSPEQRDEYRIMKLLQPVKTLVGVDPVLRETLGKPFCLIPVPADANPFSAFAGKGDPNRIQLLYQATGFEVHRYSIPPLSRPDDPRGKSPCPVVIDNR